MGYFRRSGGGGGGTGLSADQEKLLQDLQEFVDADTLDRNVRQILGFMLFTQDILWNWRNTSVPTKFWQGLPADNQAVWNNLLSTSQIQLTALQPTGPSGTPEFNNALLVTKGQLDAANALRDVAIAALQTGATETQSDLQTINHTLSTQINNTNTQLGTHVQNTNTQLGQVGNQINSLTSQLNQLASTAGGNWTFEQIQEPAFGWPWLIPVGGQLKASHIYVCRPRQPFPGSSHAFFRVASPLYMPQPFEFVVVNVPILGFSVRLRVTCDAPTVIFVRGNLRSHRFSNAVIEPWQAMRFRFLPLSYNPALGPERPAEGTSITAAILEMDEVAPESRGYNPPFVEF